MSDFHNLIPRFFKATLTMTDNFGRWAKEAKTIDELSDLIYEESNYWFGGDNREVCKEKLIGKYNEMVRELLDGRSPTAEFKLHDSTYQWRYMPY